MKLQSLFFITTLFLGSSCVMTNKLQEAKTNVAITLDRPFLKIEETKEEEKQELVKSEGSEKEESAYYTMAYYDENGEVVHRLELEEVMVIASFRNIAERNGEVLLKFDVSIPKELQNKYYNILITPYLFIDTKMSNPFPIEPLVICGESYSNIRDRQCYFADVYKERYKSRDLLNSEMDSIINKNMISTIRNSSVLLDTTLTKNSHIVYAYTHEYKVKEDIKKVFLTLVGEVLGTDGSKYTFSSTDTIQYNLSSLTKFMDLRPRYIEKVISKYVRVEDKRFIIFNKSDTQIIEDLGDNIDELTSISNLIDSIFVQDEFIIDSIRIAASSSPEGRFGYNYDLSKRRSESLATFIKEKVNNDKMGDIIKPQVVGENWTELKSLISQAEIENKEAILTLINDYLDNDKNLDDLETYKLRRFKAYKEIREKFYPMLRSVTFTYNLKRKNMVQDTVKTSEIDQTYKQAVDLLKQRQYAAVVNIFKRYKDQNYALCLINLNQNFLALNLLKSMKPTEDINYLLAIVCCRLNRIEEAKVYFEYVLKTNRSIRFRAGLDPEMKPLLDIMPELFQ